MCGGRPREGEGGLGAPTYSAAPDVPVAVEGGGLERPEDPRVPSTATPNQSLFDRGNGGSKFSFTSTHIYYADLPDDRSKAQYLPINQVRPPLLSPHSPRAPTLSTTLSNKVYPLCISRRLLLPTAKMFLCKVHKCVRSV